MSAPHTPGSPEAALQALRWSADSQITNHFGERVWLKEAFAGGQRIGITDCCNVDEPCDWHAAIAKATTSGLSGSVVIKRSTE